MNRTFEFGQTDACLALVPDPLRLVEVPHSRCRSIDPSCYVLAALMSNRFLTEVLPGGDQQSFPCDSCGTNTNHMALTGVQEREIDDHAGVEGWTKLWTLQCLGCKAISFFVEAYSSEVMECDDQGNTTYPPVRTVLYPYRLAGRRMLPDEAIPPPIYAVYAETYKALSNQLPVLGGIGIRAMLEMMCKDRGLVNGSLKEKIDGLAKLGIVGPGPAEVLHNMRFLGNMAAHEAVAHESEELLGALEMIEHLLQSLYVLPHVARTVRSRPSGR